MKYKPEMYLDCGLYDGDFGDDIENHQERVVKCRNPHQCIGGCDGEIKPGEYALLETGFMDGEPVSCYTCLPCIDEWLDELHEDEAEKNCLDCGHYKKCVLGSPGKACADFTAKEFTP